jgi:hypothetical protein
MLNPPTLFVEKIADDTPIHCDFTINPWDDIKAETLSNHMGEQPDHRPVTQFKIAYGKHALTIIFQVEDCYVKAVADRYQGPVYQDSCVEFFFSPGPMVTHGYFNLEVNCCGMALFEYHPVDSEEFIRIPEDAFKKIFIVSSLNGPIEQEITNSLTWSVSYRLPYDILNSYTDVTRPSPGTEWRGNFYKCADKTSHPHWLTWAPVHFPKPRFHLPEYFGHLKFV